MIASSKLNHSPISQLNVSNLEPYWKLYFDYEKNDPTLHALTKKELEDEIQMCLNKPPRVVDSKNIILNVIKRLGSQLNVVNNAGQVLGMQLYRIMVEDTKIIWSFTESKDKGAQYPHAKYWAN